MGVPSPLPSRAPLEPFASEILAANTTINAEPTDGALRTTTNHVTDTGDRRRQVRMPPLNTVPVMAMAIARAQRNPKFVSAELGVTKCSVPHRDVSRRA